MTRKHRPYPTIWHTTCVNASLVRTTFQPHSYQPTQSFPQGTDTMKTLTHKTVLALLATLSVVSLAVPAAVASQPQPLLIAPGEPNGPYFPLPKFGFASFNINGFG